MARTPLSYPAYLAHALRRRSLWAVVVGGAALSYYETNAAHPVGGTGRPFTWVEVAAVWAVAALSTVVWWRRWRANGGGSLLPLSARHDRLW